MKYRLYQLDFYNGVRFGEDRLENTHRTFHADTLFSALFQEAMKLEQTEQLLAGVREGRLRWTDAFPYIGDCYYMPKPVFQPDITREDHKGDSSEKKKFKNLKYIPADDVAAYMKGDFPEEHLEDMRQLGGDSVKTSAAIRGHEETQPYRVSAYYFEPGNGLYVIVGYADEADRILFDELMGSLAYTGLGGKKSAGLGRFGYMEKPVPAALEQHLNRESSRYKILLSTALPQDEVLADVLEDASYMLIKRSGFIDSTTYDSQMMRKQDLYVFAPGACFAKAFAGQLLEERNGGRHPVYRYAYAFFLGVDL